jgi:CubicO group peptidase (beta-lactamase class C family)
MNTAKRPFRLLALAALLVGSGALAAPDSIVEQVDRAVAEDDVLSAAVAYRKGASRTHHFAGRTAADGDDAPDVDTAYAIGSISKALTNLLLAERVEAGRVAYTTTLAELLDGEVEFANPAVASITLEQLATHTSGLPRLPANLQVAANPEDPYADYGPRELRQAVAGAREAQPLVEQYAYSNFGVGLLGWLLGHEAGIGYAELLAREVLDPLGMEATGPVPGDHAAQAWSQGQTVPAWTFDALAGAGALWSSTDDLMRLADVLLGDRANPLDHSLAGDFEPVAAAGEFDVTRVWHRAETAEGPLYWHNGGTAGHRSFFGVRPATDEALVILVAGDLAPTGLGLEHFGVQPIERPAAAFDSEVLGQYTLAPNVGLAVFERDGQLFTQLSGQSALPIEVAGEDVYGLSSVDASLRFLREDGEVVAVELIQNGRVQRAEKTANRAAVLDRESEALDESALLDFVGEYALGPQFKFTVRLGGESGLEVQLTGQPFFPVFASGDDVFFYKVVDAELHFERDGEGRVVAVVLHQGGVEQRAERIGD